MCGGGSTSSTTVQQIPQQVLDQYQNVMNFANQVGSLPYQQYTGPLVAGTTAAQNQAYNNINSSQGLGQQYYNASTNYLNQGASPVSSSAISNYMSPYLNNVVDATRANMQENNAQAANNLTGNAISAGAFGGDRAGVAQAELARQQNLADNQTIAGLYNQGFNTSLSAAQQDQQNALNAAGQLGNLGTAASTTALNEANAQLQAGNQQQQQQQNILNAQYQQWQNQQQYPYDTATWLSQLSTGIGSNMGGSSTTTTNSAAGGRVKRGLGGALDDALANSDGFTQGHLPTAPAVSAPNKTGQTLQTIGQLASIAALFLKDGGRVGKAGGGGAFTPTIAPTISGAQAVDPSSGTYLPTSGSPLQSLQKLKGSFAHTSLPTAPAVQPQDNTSKGLGDMTQLLALANKSGLFDGSGKGDKFEGLDGEGAISQATGAVTSAVPALANAEGAFKTGAKIGETLSNAAAESGGFGNLLDSFGSALGGLFGFASGGAITENSGGLGYRRGGR